jgi:hypothetical protein
MNAIRIFNPPEVSKGLFSNRRRDASGGGDKWGAQTREYSAHHHRA